LIRDRAEESKEEEGVVPVFDGGSEVDRSHDESTYSS
jgi:hypothetical protein